MREVVRDRETETEKNREKQVGRAGMGGGGGGLQKKNYFKMRGQALDTEVNSRRLHRRQRLHTSRVSRT